MEARERPLTPEEVARLKSEPATEPVPATQRVVGSTFVAGRSGDGPPAFGSRVTQAASSRGLTTWRVDLTTSLTQEPAQPPVAEIHVAKRPRRPSRAARDESGHRPAWVEMRPEPRRAKQPRAVQVRRGDQRLDPLAVSPPDGRSTYFDTSYPWGSVCRVQTNVGFGSGVLIGPRHVLTASHVLDWSNPWAKVTAHMYGNFSSGVAWAVGNWVWTKVSKSTWTTVDEDYVVLVLDSYLGNQRGYLGYRTYDSGWDGEPWWKSIGYASDVFGGSRPVYQGDFKLDEDDFDYGPGRAMSTDEGDFMPMQSGSPIFTWFKSSKWPKVVAVVSAAVKNDSTNYVSGGSWLSDLIAWARKHSP
jgi:V8-like Glu-specific endopeptidase